MKNTLLIGFLLMSTMLVAQKNPLNLYLGGNVSTFGKELTDFGSSFKPGYFVGISMDDEITKRITIETGMDYSAKSFDNSPGKDLKADFLRVYVSGRFYFGKVFLLVGPELNINLHTQVGDITISDNSQVVTAGPLLGAGYKINDALSVYTKYHHNLVGFLNDSKIYSRTLDIGLKYRIRN